MEAFSYLGVDRHVISSVVPLGEGAPAALRSEYDVMNLMVYDASVRASVAARCADVFGPDVDFQMQPGRQVALVTRAAGAQPINVINLGAGFVQLMWIAAHLELARRTASHAIPQVGIEEPELHLHPRAQTDMARMLLSYINAGTQVIMTTQSEHMLTAILQLVLEQALSADDLVVHYIEHGRSERLDVDDDGRLSGGLRGFFEVNEEQLKRRVDLLLRKHA
jgi:hypothetical protein